MIDASEGFRKDSLEVQSPEHRHWAGFVTADRCKQLMFEDDDGAEPW